MRKFARPEFDLGSNQRRTDEIGGPWIFCSFLLLFCTRLSGCIPELTFFVVQQCKALTCFYPQPLSIEFNWDIAQVREQNISFVNLS